MLTVSSLLLLSAASIFALLGHCFTRGAKMLVASALYALGGI